MTPFTQILVSSLIIAAFGDEHTALVMYDTETVPVKRAPSAPMRHGGEREDTRGWFLSIARPLTPPATPRPDCDSPMAGR